MLGYDPIGIKRGVRQSVQDSRIKRIKFRDDGLMVPIRLEGEMKRFYRACIV